MARSTAVVGVLLTWCLVTVTVQSSGLRLLTVRSERKTESPQLTLSVDFEAAEEPQVAWFDQNPSAPFPANTTFADGKGTSTVTLDKAIYAVSLAIGQLKGQYFEMLFFSSTHGSRTQNLNVHQKDVQKGHDLAYSGSSTDVKMTTTITKPRGGGIQGYYSNSPYGKWIDKTGNLTGGEYPAIPFLTLVKEDTDQVLKVEMTIKSDEKINGFFITQDAVYFSGSNKIVNGVFDKVVVKVHEDTITGPYPDDFLSVRIKDNGGQDITALGCIPGHTSAYACALKCAADGNAVDSVKIYKAQSSPNSNPVQNAEVRQTDPFSLEASIRLDMSQDFAGVYNCEAKMANGVTKITSITVSKMNDPAKVLRVTKKTLSNNDIEVECTATGDRPLEVFFSWANTYGIPIQADGVHVVDVTPPKDSGNNVVTKITIRPPAKEPYAFCIAKNVASSNAWFFYV